MDGINMVTQPPSLGFSKIPMPTPLSEQPEYTRLQTQYQKEQAPITEAQKKYTEMVQKRNAEFEALQKQHPLKEQPTAPSAPTNKMGITEAMILGLTAALGSLGTRQPANNAMLALTAALNGYQKGNMAQFEQATKAFHEQAESIKSYNEDAIKKIELGLKGQSMGLEAQKSVLDNLIAQHGVTKEQLKTMEDTYTKSLETVQKMTQINVNLQKMQNLMRRGGEEEAAPADVTKTLVDPDSRQYFQLEKGTLRPYRIEAGQKVYATPDEQQRLRRVSDVETTERGEEKRKAKLEASYPKAKAAVTSMSESLQDSIDNIDRLLKDPEGIEAITGKTGAAYKDLPDWMKSFWPTAARAQAALNQINARAIFDELAKMRQQSPTGGALGQVTEKEEAYLKSAAAQLDQAQSTQDFTAALERFKRQVQSSKLNVEDAFEETYGEKGKESSSGLPQEALQHLSEGNVTTFRNGQKWTLKNGSPVRVE